VRTLVLGGTRFIGRAIVDELLVGGHEVLIVHRGETEPPGLPDVPHVHADRAAFATIRPQIIDFSPEGFVDCRALTRADARTVLDVVPDGVRLLVLSSVDVYRAFASLEPDHETDPLPLDETSAVRTNRYIYRGGDREGLDDYEKLDVEEEYLARGAAAIRLPMVYGEHDYQRREEFILRRVRAGRTRIPVGPSAWLESRGYVGEMARGVRLALESDRSAGEIFNLCEGKAWSVGWWIRRMLEAAGHDAELVRVPEEGLPEDMWWTKTFAQHLVIDPAKARELLGWTHADHVIGIERSVKWHLANPPDDADVDLSADDRALSPGSI
jgi:nucleoside-diphosphate-sugar epimerase